MDKPRRRRNSRTFFHTSLGFKPKSEAQNSYFSRPPGQHPSLSSPPFPLQSPIAPLNSSSLLPESCRQHCHFLLIYSSAFLQTVLVPPPPPLTLLQSPPPLSALPHHSSLAVFHFLLFFRSNAFSHFLYFPLLFLLSLLCLAFSPPLKLFLLSVSVCPPSLVRLKINDWLIHSSI